MITVIGNNRSYDEPRNNILMRNGRARAAGKDMICYLGSPDVEFVVAPDTTEVHCALGTVMVNWTPIAGAPMGFVNVTVVSCDDPGENVWSPGGVAVARHARRVLTFRDGRLIADELVGEPTDARRLLPTLATEELVEA